MAAGIPDIWEVEITSPDGTRARVLVSDLMIGYSKAVVDMNRFAKAAALSVYTFATMLEEAQENANPTRENDQPDGRGAGEDQAF